MQAQKSFYHSHISPWVLLPLRLFLGVTFVYAGIEKFADPQFFHPSKPGFIGKQMIAFAHGSPISGFLLHIVVPHVMLFGFMVAYGEIAIGLGILIGLLFRLASFFGILLSFTFFLSVTWRVYPYFYGADIVFVFGWLTLLLNGPLNTGLPTVDEFLALNLLPLTSTEQQRGLAGALNFILGTTIHPSAEPVALTDTSVTSAKGNQQRNAQQQRTAMLRRQNAEQKAREMRRSFLQGALLGGGVVFGLGAVILAYRTLFFSADTYTSTQSQGSSNSTGTGSSGGSSGGSAGSTPATQASSSTSAIAKVSSVPTNNAASFTIPSSGDPGILVHLNNGQFVAYDALCTHAGCQVEYDPTQQLIVCPCHGAEYDPAKAAAVVAGPAPTPLSPVAIHVDSATGAITLS